MIDKAQSPLLSLNRRHLLKSGIFGIAAMGSPSSAHFLSAKGFTHGVASGEPGPDSILLWTRYVGGENGSNLRAEIAEDANFAKIILAGEITARPERDHIAKITLSSLQPGRQYHYRFVTENGEISDIGRTKTLPSGPVSSYNMAVFSCANMPFGWFNAYAHAAQRSDIDLVVMLGDYLYEYRQGTYPSASESVTGRILEPAGEMVALADYRIRYAAYRADRDLQELHRLNPVIAMWDDHEFANDAWEGGAENHHADEGDWSARKKAAEQAWREWMPVRDIEDDIRWTRYDIGDLAAIHMTESRVGARSHQAEFRPAVSSPGELAAALKEFCDTVWQNEDRTMLGAVQEEWLANGFRTGPQKWNIWAQQVIVGSIYQPAGAVDLLKPGSPEFVRKRVAGGQKLASLGLPSNMDAWDGYPAARARTLSAAQSANADLIVLTGDSHNGWAFNLPHDGQAAGVEFAGQSVTSPGLEAYFADSAAIARSLVGTNPQMAWMNADRRGYMTAQLTPEKATSNWHMLDSIIVRDNKLSDTHIMSVRHGARALDST